MDPTHQGLVFVKGTGIFTRWRKHYSAVFTNSECGMARLEVYSSESDFELGRNPRYILLANCVSFRTVKTGHSKIHFAVQIVINDPKAQQLSLGCIKETEAKIWQDALSRAAFPQQYAVLFQKNGAVGAKPTSPLTPSSPGSYEDNPYDTPWDVHQIKVLLIPSESSRRLGIAEGAYDLTFGSEALLLKCDNVIVEAWDYKLVTWFGYGDKCCCFEMEGNQTFEFKCSKPDTVYERLRTQIRVKPDPNPNRRPLGVLQSYYASYVPIGIRGEGLKAHQLLNSAPRSIFAPRVSVDAAFPSGIYAIPERRKPEIRRMPSLIEEGTMTRKEPLKRTRTDFGNTSAFPASPVQKEEPLSKSFAGQSTVQETSEKEVGRNRFLSKIFGSKRKKNKKSKAGSVSMNSSVVEETDWTYSPTTVAGRHAQSSSGLGHNGASLRRGSEAPPPPQFHPPARRGSEAVKPTFQPALPMGLRPVPPPRSRKPVPQPQLQADLVQELGQRLNSLHTSSPPKIPERPMIITQKQVRPVLLPSYPEPEPIIPSKEIIKRRELMLWDDAGNRDSIASLPPMSSDYNRNLGLPFETYSSQPSRNSRNLQKSESFQNADALAPNIPEPVNNHIDNNPDLLRDTTMAAPKLKFEESPDGRANFSRNAIAPNVFQYPTPSHEDSKWNRTQSVDNIRTETTFDALPTPTPSPVAPAIPPHKPTELLANNGWGSSVHSEV